MVLRRRVAITGLGVLSPIGIDKEGRAPEEPNSWEVRNQTNYPF